jgi:hypothetical protein
MGCPNAKNRAAGSVVNSVRQSQVGAVRRPCTAMKSMA